jgi:hypothetical protein
MKSFFISALVLLLAGSHVQAQKLSVAKLRNRGVRYAPHAAFKKYPLPVVNFQRPGLASEKERMEIVEEIVYPLVNESPRAIAAVVLELVPVNPHPKTRAEIAFNQITVLVLWHDGGYTGASFDRNVDGHFGKDTYRLLLGTGTDECAHDEDSAPPVGERSDLKVATRRRAPQRKLRRQ